MKKLSRRNFLQTTAITAAALGGLTPTLSEAAVSKKVVVAGGGYGGSTTAKYLKLLDPTIEVTLVDRNDIHVSCAMSNEVIFGYRDWSFINIPHKALADRYGVKFVKAEVTGLDKNKKELITSAGRLKYDKLVVAPGIAPDYDVEAGFDEEMQKEFPHAWIAGPQTLQLKKMVDNLKKGATIVMRTPKALYRCPPGPYERASLFAERAKALGGKLIILDPNPQIMSKKPLFENGFNTVYKDVATYIPNVNVTGWDKKKKAIITDKGTFTGDLINFVPNQKAGQMAFDLGLVEEGKKWVTVDPKTFEAKLAKDVYIAGDAIDSGPVTEMPKSGVVANGMGKTIAENIVRMFQGKEPLPPIIGNSCYSLVTKDEGIWIASVYEYDPKVNKIVVRNGANGIPAERTVENARNLHSWAANVLQDTFY